MITIRNLSWSFNLLVCHINGSTAHSLNILKIWNCQLSTSWSVYSWFSIITQLFINHSVSHEQLKLISRCTHSLHILLSYFFTWDAFAFLGWVPWSDQVPILHQTDIQLMSVLCGIYTWSLYRTQSCTWLVYNALMNYVIN